MILDELIANMGVSLETYILIIIILGSMIFMAKDFRLGLVIAFILTGSFFIIFENFNRNVTYYLYAMLIELTLLTLSLMISNERGGIV